MDGSTEMKWSEWSDTLEKIECCCQEMGKEKGGIVVECVQSFCFARGKKSWGLVAQNVNVLNMEMGQVVSPCPLPAFCLW